MKDQEQLHYTKSLASAYQSAQNFNKANDEEKVQPKIIPEPTTPEEVSQGLKDTGSGKGTSDSAAEHKEK